MKKKTINFVAFGQNWKIKFLKNHKYFTTKEDGTQEVGAMSTVTNTIYIKTHDREGNLIPDSALQSCILHEMLHLVEQQLNIKIKHDDIDRFEMGLFDILSQNGFLNFNI